MRVDAGATWDCLHLLGSAVVVKAIGQTLSYSSLFQSKS